MAIWVSCYCYCIQLFVLFVNGVWRFEFLATVTVYSYLCCLLVGYGDLSFLLLLLYTDIYFVCYWGMPIWVSCYCYCTQIFMLFVNGVWRFEFLATVTVYSYLCCLLLGYGDLSFLLPILYLASPAINNSKHYIYLNIIQKFNSYLNVSTMPYKEQLHIYSKNITKNTGLQTFWLFAQMIQLLSDNPLMYSGCYTNHVFWHSASLHFAHRV